MCVDLKIIKANIYNRRERRKEWLLKTVRENIYENESLAFII